MRSGPPSPMTRSPVARACLSLWQGLPTNRSRVPSPIRAFTRPGTPNVPQHQWRPGCSRPAGAPGSSRVARRNAPLEPHRRATDASRRELPRSPQFAEPSPTGTGSPRRSQASTDAPRVVFTDPQVAAVGPTLPAALPGGHRREAIDSSTSGTAAGSFHGPRRGRYHPVRRRHRPQGADGRHVRRSRRRRGPARRDDRHRCCCDPRRRRPVRHEEGGSMTRQAATWSARCHCPRWPMSFRRSPRAASCG
jgi:hypothetical protein